MNGPHDLGGSMGFGPVRPEPDEPVFHAPWEGRMFALKLAAGWVENVTLDASRHQHEVMPPGQYLTSSYYQIWLASLEKSLVAQGLATAAEIAQGRSASPPAAVPGILHGDEVAQVVVTPQSYRRQANSPALFAIGARVRARNLHKVTHTRLPRYARGHVGTIERINGCMVYPDSNAHGLGEDPHWCYSVSFSGRELWGPDADPGLSVALDLWEPYLDAA